MPISSSIKFQEKLDEVILVMLCQNSDGIGREDDNRLVSHSLIGHDYLGGVPCLLAPQVSSSQTIQWDQVKDVKFVDPGETFDEEGAGIDFRHKFMLEEKFEEDCCRLEEREYERFQLPNVRIMDKVLVEL